MGQAVKFYIKPSEDEQIETIVRLTKDRRSILKGIVSDENGAVVADACVMLYDTLGKSSRSEYALREVGCTDEDGTFVLGPLDASVLYAVYITKNELNVRELEFKLPKI